MSLPFPEDMLLLCFVLTLICSSSSLQYKVVCYGKDYYLPFHQMKTDIFYKPEGGELTLVVHNGESKDPRFKVTFGNVKMQDLTEQDNGAFLSFDESQIVKLNIKECQEPQTHHYGGLFSWEVPSHAKYLEFSQTFPNKDPAKPVVLWNRTDPGVAMGTVVRNYYELYGLKQKDSGYYRFRGSENKLLRWKRLVVQEYFQQIETKEGDNLFVDGPIPLSSLKVFFTPEGSQYKHQLQEDTSLNERTKITKSYFSILNVNSADSGTYEFHDDENFLALRVEVEVTEAGTPFWVFVVIPIFVLTTIFCCCCMKRCCCKKSSNKRNDTADQTVAAAPNVYYHDTTQPTQPVVPLLHREPRVISPVPPVKAPGDLGTTTLTSTSYDFTSSESEPRFELKERTFPFAPPLNLDTSVAYVYTSDKLNF